MEILINFKNLHHFERYDWRGVGGGEGDRGSGVCVLLDGVAHE